MQPFESDIHNPLPEIPGNSRNSVLIYLRAKLKTLLYITIRIREISIATFGIFLCHLCLFQAYFSGLIASHEEELSLGAGVTVAGVLLRISRVVSNFIPLLNFLQVLVSF